MASIDTSRSFAAPMRGLSVTAMVARLADAVQGWNDARVTRKSLTRLSDRELEDIGLCRGDIDRIAAHGAR